MEHLFDNCEVVTLDTEIQPRHKLMQLFAIVAALAIVLALAIPQAQAGALVVPTPGDAARAAICGTMKP